MTKESTLILPPSERAEYYELVKKRDHNEELVENQFKLENWLKD
jgi:hypothetical protein